MVQVKTPSQERDGRAKNFKKGIQEALPMQKRKGNKGSKKSSASSSEAEEEGEKAEKEALKEKDTANNP